MVLEIEMRIHSKVSYQLA